MKICIMQFREQPIDEKNFDIEKWRRETPMDYLKAMYIMNMADGVAKDMIFKEIYKITRLYYSRCIV